GREACQRQGAVVVGTLEGLELDGHAEGARAAAGIEEVRHLVREMADVRLLARHHGWEAVGKGLRALPDHGGENSTISPHDLRSGPPAPAALRRAGPPAARGARAGGPPRPAARARRGAR